jgi:hypothetical protein
MSEQQWSSFALLMGTSLISRRKMFHPLRVFTVTSVLRYMFATGSLAGSMYRKVIIDSVMEHADLVAVELV